MLLGYVHASSFYDHDNHFGVYITELHTSINDHGRTTLVEGPRAYGKVRERVPADS